MSVPCGISGCYARVIGDTRCSEHGGQPVYEWTDSPWGDVTYRARISRDIQSETNQEPGGATS